jgi:hypothetical protein
MERAQRAMALVLLAACVSCLAPKRITYTTCATDLVCGLTTYLKLGTTELEWSNGAGTGGWLYCNDRQQTDDVGVWEFSLSGAKHPEDIQPGQVFSAEFCGMESSDGVRLFGTNWHGRAISVHTGEVIFARRSDDPGAAYAMEIYRKDEGWRVWVKYRIAERLDGNISRWRTSADISEEDDRQILGTPLRLSPEEARAALVELISTRGFLYEELDQRIATELKSKDIVVIRGGIIVIGRAFRCNLREGSFAFEFGSPDRGFYQSHSGTFQRDGKVWTAVLTRSAYGEGAR